METKPKKKSKAVFIAIALIIFIIALGLLTTEAYDTIIGRESNLKTEVKTLQRDKDHLIEELNKSTERFIELNTQEENLKNKYHYEYNRRVKAEKDLNNIQHLIFGNEYLDSLAKYIQYR